MSTRFSSLRVRTTFSPVRLLLVAYFAFLPIPRQFSAEPSANAKAPHKPVVSLGLREYVERIAAESPKILTSRLDEAAADYEARSTYASYLPHLTGEARVGYIKGKRLTGFAGLQQPDRELNNVPTAPNTREFTQEGPGLTIPVFKDGSFLGINVPPEVARKRAHRQVIKFEGSLTTQDVILSATEAYLRAIRATRLLELRTKHFALAQKEAARVENRATSNLATAEELGAARRLLETSRASSEAQQGETIYSFLAVADLLGVDAGSIRIRENYPEPSALPDFEMIAGLSSKEHPKVRLQEASIQGAKADVALQRSRQYPSVKAESFDFQYGDFHGHAANQWVSFMSVSVPVFDFGETALAIRSADLKLRAENERLLAVQQDLRKELVDAFVQVKQSGAAFAKAGSDVAEQQRVATRLEEQAKLDQAVLGQLNSAELKLLDSKEALEEAHYELLFQYARFQRVTAGEWKWIAR